MRPSAFELAARERESNQRARERWARAPHFWTIFSAGMLAGVLLTLFLVLRWGPQWP